MKILTVVGARPQFIKAAVVSRLLRNNATEILVHTGKHYDYNMSDLFFEELSIPRPDYNLGISGGTHGVMTGKMLASIEEVQQFWSETMRDKSLPLRDRLKASELHAKATGAFLHIQTGDNTASGEVDGEDVVFYLPTNGRPIPSSLNEIVDGKQKSRA